MAGLNNFDAELQRGLEILRSGIELSPWHWMIDRPILKMDGYFSVFVRFKKHSRPRLVGIMSVRFISSLELAHQETEAQKDALRYVKECRIRDRLKEEIDWIGRGFVLVRNKGRDKLRPIHSFAPVSGPAPIETAFVTVGG